MNPKVDAFLKRQDKWRAEFTELRETLLGTALTKWVGGSATDGLSLGEIV